MQTMASVTQQALQQAGLADSVDVSGVRCTYNKRELERETPFRFLNVPSAARIELITGALHRCSLPPSPRHQQTACSAGLHHRCVPETRHTSRCVLTRCRAAPRPASERHAGAIAGRNSCQHSSDRVNARVAARSQPGSSSSVVAIRCGPGSTGCRRRTVAGPFSGRGRCRRSISRGTGPARTWARRAGVQPPGSRGGRGRCRVRCAIGRSQSGLTVVLQPSVLAQGNAVGNTCQHSAACYAD